MKPLLFLMLLILAVAGPSRAVVWGPSIRAKANALPGRAVRRLALYYDGAPARMLELRSALSPGQLAADLGRAAERRGLTFSATPALVPEQLSFLGSLPKGARNLNLEAYFGQNKSWLVISYGLARSKVSGAILLQTILSSQKDKGDVPGFDPRSFPKPAFCWRSLDLLIQTSRGWPGLYQYRSASSLRFILTWLKSQLPGHGFQIEKEMAGKKGLVVWQVSRGVHNLLLAARPEPGKDAWAPGCSFSLVTDLPPDGWVGN